MTTENKPQEAPTPAQPAPAPTPPATPAAQQEPPDPQYTRERLQFRALVLANPNYFGNIKASPFPPVLNIQSNTTYEEIGCVGFQPQLNRLEPLPRHHRPR